MKLSKPNFIIADSQSHLISLKFMNKNNSIKHIFFHFIPKNIKSLLFYFKFLFECLIFLFYCLFCTHIWFCCIWVYKINVCVYICVWLIWWRFCYFGFLFLLIPGLLLFGAWFYRKVIRDLSVVLYLLLQLHFLVFAFVLSTPITLVFTYYHFIFEGVYFLRVGTLDRS